MSPAKSPNISGFFATQTAIFHCAKTQMQNRRFPFVDRLELPKSKYQIHRQIEIKNLSAFFITFIKEKTDMLQKELAKRLKARYDTKMDGNGWLEVSSDGMPLCRVKYNGNCIVNDNPYLSEEYLGKIAEVQNDLLTVKEHVALYDTHRR